MKGQMSKHNTGMGKKHDSEMDKMTGRMAGKGHEAETSKMAKGHGAMKGGKKGK